MRFHTFMLQLFQFSFRRKKKKKKGSSSLFFRNHRSHSQFSFHWSTKWMRKVFLIDWFMFGNMNIRRRLHKGRFVSEIFFNSQPDKHEPKRAYPLNKQHENLLLTNQTSNTCFKWKWKWILCHTKEPNFSVEENRY